MAGEELLDQELVERVEMVSDLRGHALELCRSRLAAYRVAPRDTLEHHNIEQSVLAGGYAYRQVAEVVQNAADAVVEAGTGSGRIEVAVDRHGFWAANTGAPVDENGVSTLLSSNASSKRAGQIGRFGLGFKSLLKLGGTISVFSRSVCLLFNPKKCQNTIRRELQLPDGTPAPGLRLADVCTWEEALELRPELGRHSWATTVVHAELLSPGAVEALAEEMRRFPAEFLLFLPIDVELVLEAEGIRRQMRRRTEDDGTVLIEDLADADAAPQRWRVFETEVRVTDQAAREDATAVHARDSVPMIWAAPVGAARENAGLFYAFFPTDTSTRTLGLLNAPWKLNSDRTALIPGAWNSALMLAAAEFMVSCMPSLSREDDPGAVLDAYPRELENQNEPAVPLVNALWDRLTVAAVLPDCDGILVPAASLLRHPHDLPEAALAWSRLADPQECSRYVHPTCLATRTRYPRLNQLADRIAKAGQPDGQSRLARAELKTWFELTATSDITEVPHVLRLADLFASAVQGQVWSGVRDKLCILPGADGQLMTAVDATLDPAVEPPLRPVHPTIAGDPASRRILQERFQLRDAEGHNWILSYGRRVDAADRSGDWAPVWALLRRMPMEDAAEAIGDQPPRVLTLGGWAEHGSCIRSGAIVKATDLAEVPEPDRAALALWIVDERFHSGDADFLDELGVREHPMDVWDQVQVREYAADTVEGRFLKGWEKNWRDKYWERLDKRPDPGYLVAAHFYLPRGWQLGLLARGGAKLRMCRHLLSLIEHAGPYQYRAVEFRHSTRSGHWGPHPYPHPLWWFFLREAKLTEGQRTLELGKVLDDAVSAVSAIIPSLAPVSAGLARLQKESAGWRIAGAAQEIWAYWLAYAAEERCDPQDLVKLYSLAAGADVCPALVATSQGPVALERIVVVRNDRDRRACTAAGHICIQHSSEAAALWITQGAISFDTLASLAWLGQTLPEEPLLLTDMEPAFQEVLKPEVVELAAAYVVPELRQRIGDVEQDLAWAAHQRRLVISGGEWARVAWEERIRILLEASTVFDWLADGADVDQVIRSGATAQRRAVAREPDLPSRLLKAVGNPAVLASLFDDDIRVELESDPYRLSSAVLTLLGPAALTEVAVQEAFVRQGLAPPDRWGGEAAAQFVAALGFPAEFAASPSRRRAPELTVSGPVPLRPLHDYQEEVVTAVDGLLAVAGNSRRRAVISLPTGAGKTRVAAETAIRRVLTEDSSLRLVVWVAQTDELCEQAVQCFRELWANIGCVADTLRIVRFWGSQSNPASAEPDDPTVVVTTIQTLSARMGQAGLDWLSRPGLLVIDECHHALTSSYTGVLRWLRDDAAPAAGGEPPILGLSATPFRGRSEEETEQLARRFDGRLIPAAQGDLFSRLQDRGVLARFKYTRLDMEEPFLLSPEEQRHFEQFRVLPDTAMERLGRDATRNERIVEAVTQAAERSILVFATSVAHARRLAARLTMAGVPAAVVSGETDRNSRRWFVSAFQRGDIRALCNHSTLTTGFDAPATDLIVIARPVFSPSMYMQMVGRGLRGPLNGGKPLCRILTVQDNLDRYSSELAHHYFERYYAP